MFSLNPLSYLLGGSTLALAVALGGVTISKNSTIHELRSTVTQVSSDRDRYAKDLATSQRNAAELQLSINEQNTEVDRLKAESERRKALLDKLKESDAAADRSRDILSRKGETCEDADKLILELVR